MKLALRSAVMASALLSSSYALASENEQVFIVKTNLSDEMLVSNASKYNVKIGSEFKELGMVSLTGSHTDMEKMQEDGAILYFAKNTGVTSHTESDVCRIKGHYKLGIKKDNVKWRISNYGDDAVLESLSISYPSILDAPHSVKIDGNKYKDIVYSTDDAVSTVVIDAGDQIKSDKDFDIKISFNDDIEITQQELKIVANFDNDCEVESVKGYDTGDKGDSDSFFPTTVGASVLHKQGITGEGVTVAVIDSGIWGNSALSNNTHGEGRILDEIDVVDQKTGKAADEYGHGTHIASIIASSDPVTKNHEPTGSYKGIAPDANLVVVRAFNDEGQATLLDIMRAFDVVLSSQEAYNIKVLNLSFGADPQGPYWADPISYAVMEAWNRGIVVITSAGNNGKDGHLTINTPANNPYVVTVGASSDNYTPTDITDDFSTTYSSKGPTKDLFIKPDLVAPGSHLVGFIGKDSYIAKNHAEFITDKNEFMISGTSQSAAVVSGIAALLLSQDESLTPDDVKCKLMSGTVPLNNGVEFEAGIFDQGMGAINAIKVLSSPYSDCANKGKDIEADLAGTAHYSGQATVTDDGKFMIVAADGQLMDDAQFWSESQLWGNVRSELWEGDASLWSDSQLWGNAELWNDSQLWGNVRSDSQLWGNVRSQLWGNVHSQLWGNVRSQLWGNVRSQLWGNVRSQLWGNVRSQLWGNVRSQLWGNVNSDLLDVLSQSVDSNSQLWGNVNSQLWGNVNADLWGDNTLLTSDSQLWGNVNSQLWGNVRSQLWGNVRSQLWGNVRSQLWGNVDSQLWGNVRSQLWGNVRSQLWGMTSQLWGMTAQELESNAHMWGNVSSQLWGMTAQELESNAHMWGNVSSQLWGMTAQELESNGHLWGNVSSQLWGMTAQELESNAHMWGNVSSQLWGNVNSDFTINSEIQFTSDSKE